LSRPSLELATEWDRLATKLDASPFLFSGWTLMWHKCFSQEALTILTARSQGRLVGVAPLQRRSGRRSSPANWHTPEYGWLAMNEGVLRALSKNLLDAGARRLELRFIDEANPLLAIMTGDDDFGGRKIHLRALERSPRVTIEGSWKVFEQNLRTKFVAELRRRSRNLERQGALSLVVEEGPRALQFLAEGFAVEASGWKGRRRSAITSRPSTHLFYRKVAEWAAGRGWLRLAFLRVADEAIAFDFCLEARGVHYLLKTGFKPAYSSFGPGQLLRCRMLKRAFDARLDSYEFLGDLVPWKQEWTNEYRTLVALQVFAPHLVGRMDHLLNKHGRAVAKRGLALARKARP